MDIKFYKHVMKMMHEYYIKNAFKNKLKSHAI